MVGLHSTLCITMMIAVAAHPIGDVISLLQGLEVQSKEEGAKEAALFQKFSYWCKTSQKELKGAIAKENDNIAELTSKIEGLKADITSLGTEISNLDTELTDMNNAAAKAKKIRDDQEALYSDEQGNFDGTITAVDEATDLMKDNAGLLQTPGGRGRVQKAVSRAQLSHRQMSQVQSLLQTDSEAAPSKPDAQAYESKTGGIIETFKGMNSEFEAEKLDSTTAETNKVNAYTLAKAARDSAISAAESSKSEKEGIKSDKESDLSSSKISLSQEKDALVSDSTTLDNTNKECVSKTEEWNTRSAVRKGEITAMQMAQKILSKVTGVRNPDEHEIPAKSALFAVNTHVQQDTSNLRMALSLLQVGDLDPRARAVNLIREAAKTGHSKAMAKLAEELMVYEGPFDKIKGMMQKMIFQLMAEQKDEDDHKNWCDLETEKNTESHDDKNNKVQDMTTKSNDMKANIDELTRQIGQAVKHIADLQDMMKRETELRNENHAEILATIKDSQDAQKAVTQATQVLKEFYKSSGAVPKEPWEFLQGSSKPETWDSSYTATENPQDGILAILDGCLQEFSTMEADAKAQDATDQQNFDQDMSAAKIDLETTRTDSDMKTSKKDALTQKKEGLDAQLKSTKTEYDAVGQYLKDLEPACGEGDSSYGDRKQARSDEIEALRKAQGILEEAFRAKMFLQRS